MPLDVTIQREPPGARVLSDACRLIIVGVLVGSILAVVLFLPKIRPAWLDTLGRGIAALIVHLLAVALLRELVPKPVIGAHRIGRDPAYVRWLVSSAYNDVVNHPLIAWPYSVFYATRWVYLRAQGAQIAWGASLPRGLRIEAPSLFVLEKGAQLEDGVSIFHASHTTGRLRVDSVILSKGSLIGARTLVMPGVVLGPDARVSAGSYLGPDVQLGIGAKVGERATLATGVDIGSNARVGPGAVLAERVIVADNARIMAGAVIPPKTRIRQGEVWQGVPARPMFRDGNVEPRELTV